MSDYLTQAEQTINEVVRQLTQMRSAAEVLAKAEAATTAIVDGAAKAASAAGEAILHLGKAAAELRELGANLRNERAQLTSEIRQNLQFHLSQMQAARQAVEPLRGLVTLPSQLEQVISETKADLDRVQREVGDKIEQNQRMLTITLRVSAAAAVLGLLNFLILLFR